jgi:3-hydroxybutyryl-CoA dehydrogenase
MEIKKICVTGAGTMGHGIAQVCATSGYPISLFDISDAILEKAFGNIRKSLDRFVEKGKIPGSEKKTILDRIACTVQLEIAVKEADLVIEAVPEDIQLKKEVFTRMDRLCKGETILASNTSQYSISDIASATQRPQKVVGMHWFVPPVLMGLIEIVQGIETSAETIQTIEEIARRVGKETVVCKDAPGFITTRALAALTVECLRMLEEGVATAEDIDKAVRLGLNHPMGPFQVADLSGLDTSLHAIESLADVYGDRFLPSVTYRNLVRSGRLGRKTGRGIYKYEER